MINIITLSILAILVIIMYEYTWGYYIEGMTNDEAVANLASIYNKTNMQVTNINVSGNLTGKTINGINSKITTNTNKINAIGSKGAASSKTVTSGYWGSWRGWASCPSKHYVCGLQARVEKKQGKGDDTAMNGLQMKCCPLH